MKKLELQTVETRKIYAVFGDVDDDDDIHLDFRGEPLYLPLPLLRAILENKELLAERYGV